MLFLQIKKYLNYERSQNVLVHSYVYWKTRLKTTKLKKDIYLTTLTEHGLVYFTR